MKASIVLTSLLMSVSLVLADSGATLKLYSDNKEGGYLLDTVIYPVRDHGNADGQCLHPERTIKSYKIYEGTDTGVGGSSETKADYCLYLFKTDLSCSGTADEMVDLPEHTYGVSNVPETVSAVFRKHKCPDTIPALIPLD